MKLLFIIDSLGIGGAEKSLLTLLTHLDGMGHDLYLWIQHRGGAFEAMLPRGVHVLEQKDLGKTSRVAGFVNRMAFSLLLRLMKKRHGAETKWKSRLMEAGGLPKDTFDVVVAYQQGIPTFLAAKYFTGAKKVAWVNADLASVGYDSRFCRGKYDKIDEIVAVSDVLRDKIMADGFCGRAANVHVVYDLISPKVVNEWSHEKEIKKDVFTLVTVGRMAPPKGHLLALRAAVILRQKGLNFRWIFVGDGPEREKIEQFVAENGLEDYIELAGATPNPYPYMRIADIYVQPSLSEGFGMSLAEAKMLCRPIVATDFQTAALQIENGKNGIICEKNAETLAEAILRLHGDAAMRSRLSAYLSERVENNVAGQLAVVRRVLGIE
ncbi:MAG: glycosyltransferase [Muribaculaceae bacterium]